jgi:hypothetical protein
MLVFHGQPTRPSRSSPYRPHRGPSGRHPENPATISIRDRCIRGAAGPPACGVDFAAWRCRLLDTLAANQVTLRTFAPQERTIISRPPGTRRARHLAASILGAPDQRRRGLRASRGILLHQIRSSTRLSGASVTGHIPRSIGMYAREFFPKAGRGIPKRWERSVNAFDRRHLRLESSREWRITLR